MRELTKQQRHEVYKHAIKTYQSRWKGVTGLCFVLQDAMLAKAKIQLSYYFIPKCLPEFESKLHMLKDGLDDIPNSRTKERVAILEACIKETAE